MLIENTSLKDKDTVGENALQLLKRDHDTIKRLFGQYRARRGSGGSSAVRTSVRDLCIRICDELAVHTQLEDEIFYPACQRALGEEARTLLRRSIEEHAEVSDLILEIRGLDESDLDLFVRVDDLIDMVEDHVRDEENELFALCLRGMEQDELRSLGAELERRRAELRPARDLNVAA